LLAPRPTPKLEDHPSSAVRDCLFNLFADTLLIGGRSSIRILPQYSYRFQYHTLVMNFIGTTKAFGLLLHLITLSETHTRYDSSGRRISPSQRPLPANTQHSQKTDIHASRGVRTRNPIKRVSADRHWLISLATWIQFHNTLCMSQILTAMMRNIKGLRNVTTCRLLNSYRCFKGKQFLHLHRQSDQTFFGRSLYISRHGVTSMTIWIFTP